MDNYTLNHGYLVGQIERELEELKAVLARQAAFLKEIEDLIGVKF